jgi:anti-sigma factor RsiW
MTNIARPVGEEDLQGWVDGRLTPERQEAVRDYLTRHPEERGRLSQYGEQKRALRAAFRGPTEPIPARLQGARLIASSRRRQRHHLIQFAAAILLLVVGGLAGWLGGAIGWPFAAAGSITADAIAAHQVFAVEVRHPVEVPAAQQTHLGQWLTNRLGRPLIIPDLTSFGLQLMGGRVLPSEAGPAAQLMYDDTGGNRFTVYVRVGFSGETRHYEQHGQIGALLWIDEGFACVIVGRADRDVLTRIAERVYEQFLPNSPKGEVTGGEKKG